MEEVFTTTTPTWKLVGGNGTDRADASLESFDDWEGGEDMNSTTID